MRDNWSPAFSINREMIDQDLKKVGDWYDYRIYRLIVYIRVGINRGWE